MITIRAGVGKYFFSDFINLSNGIETILDETLLTFRQLETLSNAINSQVILISPDDLSIVQASLLLKGTEEDSSCDIGLPSLLDIHANISSKEDKSNKVKTIATVNDIQYPSIGAVVKYVNNAVCHLPVKQDLYKYALKAELSCLVHKSDLSKYATIAYVDTKVDTTNGSVDLSEYYKSSETDLLLSEKVDKEDDKTLSSHDFTTDYKSKLDTLDDLVLSFLDGYSSTIEMDDAIAKAIRAAQFEDIGIDLSDYYLATEVDERLSLKADKTELLGLASETYVITALSNFCAAPPVELSEYAKKTEVESLVIGLASKEFVSDAIASINIPEVDLEDYITKGELTSELTAYKTSTQIDEDLEKIKEGVPKLDVIVDTVAPILADSIPLYTLGSNGEYILCTPDEWIDVGNGLVIPAYNRRTIGLS